MPPLRKAILAGAAAIALVGVAGWAAAEIKNAHTLDVRLPDGSLAHIRYVGDTPPTVSFAPAPSALSILSPASDPFGAGSPFAALEQITQAMDRQGEAMLPEASAQPRLAFTGPDLMQLDIGKLPPGAQGSSMVSTMSGNGVCTRSVEYRALADKPPHVIFRTSAACAPDEKRPTPSVTSASTAVASPSERAGRRPI